MIPPSAAVERHPLADGVVALPGGFAFLTASRVLLCADAHLGYEDVMGGGAAALPLWSTDETIAAIAVAARRAQAREIVVLGDVLHGSHLSAGAARRVRAGLETLRGIATLTLIAGNHEGRSRGIDVLGSTVEGCERDGWRLVHGDRPAPFAGRTIVGHLHPSIHLGGDRSAPAFLGARSLVVVPALTPYSSGLDVLGEACRAALRPWNLERHDVHVVAASDDRVFPFGTLSGLRAALRAPLPAGPGPRRRKRLAPDR